MVGDKITVTFEINSDALKMLEKITDKFDFPDHYKHSDVSLISYRKRS
jgi:hypothetical protein